MAKFDLMATWGRFWRFLVVEPCVVARPASRHRKGSCFGELLANFSPRPGPYFAAGKSLKNGLLTLAFITLRECLWRHSKKPPILQSPWPRYLLPTSLPRLRKGGNLTGKPFAHGKGARHTHSKFASSVYLEHTGEIMQLPLISQPSSVGTFKENSRSRSFP